VRRNSRSVGASPRAREENRACGAMCASRPPFRRLAAKALRCGRFARHDFGTRGIRHAHVLTHDGMMQDYKCVHLLTHDGMMQDYKCVLLLTQDDMMQSYKCTPLARFINARRHDAVL
jgi:hypothetical protein